MISYFIIVLLCFPFFLELEVHRIAEVNSSVKCMWAEKLSCNKLSNGKKMAHMCVYLKHSVTK